MATIVTRETTQTDGTSPKGSPLTNAEVDTNFINLNDDKVEVSGAIIFQAKAGEALAKGDVVYVSGVSGNTPVVSKADADDASKMPAYGLAEDAANLNAAVNVVTFGTLYDLNTSGFSAGDTVYVSTTAGALTNSAPTGESSLIQNIGMVVRSHASAGSIKVGGAGRTNATPNLNDGNVFIGNASNQAAARALTTADIASGTFADARIAQSNVTQHQAALSITESQISDLQAYLTAESDTLDSVTGRGATTTNAVTVGNLTSTGIDDNATSTAITIDSSQNVGIGTASPNALVEAQENVTDTYSASASSPPNVHLQISNEDTTTANTMSLIGFGSRGTTTTTSQWYIGNIGMNNAYADSSFIFGHRTAGSTWSEVMRLDGSGNVGIGTASPARTLDVSSGAAGVAITTKGSGTGSYITFQDGTTTNDAKVRVGAVGDNLTLFGGGSERMRIDSSGNVGIGTTSPAQQLHLSGTGAIKQRYTRNANSTDISLASNGMFNADNLAATGFGWYNNGSEAMRIDSSGNVGIGTASAGNLLHIHRDSSAGAWAQFTNTTTSAGASSGVLVGLDSNEDFRVLQYGAKAVKFYTSATERVRINSSGNVLVGTTQHRPATNNVNGVSIDATYGIEASITSGGPLTLNRKSTDGGIISLKKDGTTIGSISSNGSNLQINGAGALELQENGTTRAYVESTGFHPWADNTYDLGTSSVRWKDLYLSGDIQHKDAAGNDRLLYDRSANLLGNPGTNGAFYSVGIGTTSPATPLHVNGTTAAQIRSQATTGYAGVHSLNNSGNFYQMIDNSTGAGFSSGAYARIMYSDGAYPMAFYTNANERMRIDSSGRVGIGTNAPISDLTVSNASGGEITLRYTGNSGYTSIQTDAANDLIFGTGVGASERMRIDSSGNLILKPSGKLYLESSSGFSPYLVEASNALTVNTNGSERMRIDSSGALLIGRTSGNPNSSSFGINFDSGGRMLAASNYGATGTAHQFYGNAGSVRILGDGDLENTNNSYGALSDERLKSNIVDASSQIDDIMAVQVRSYTLNETGATHIGVVAQELEASGMSGLVKTDEEGMKSVKYSILYMKAIKALQEAVTRIETLEAEVAALKGE